MSLLLLQSSSLEIPLADNSVHVIGCSPPYWSLRKYEGESQARVWGGDKSCQHVWGDKIPRTHEGGGNVGVPQGWKRPSREAHLGGDSGMFCQLCGAWYGDLGLEPTPDMYVDHIREVSKELWRVLRPDGTFWLVIGDSYNGSGGAGGDYNDGGLRAGQPRYPGRNVDSLKPKDLVGIPWMIAFALRDDGWYLRSDCIWNKTNAMPQSVTDRPSTAHEYVFLFTKSRYYVYHQDAIREPYKTPPPKPGTTLNSKGKEMAHMINSTSAQIAAKGRTLDSIWSHGGRNKRTVWTIPTESFSGAHFATFPRSLIEIPIKAGASAWGCCPECGAQWLNVKEKVGVFQRRWSTFNKEGSPYRKQDSFQNVYQHAGWRPTCEHYPRTDEWREYPQQGDMSDEDYDDLCEFIAVLRLELLQLWVQYDAVPCTVLDPFVGSGTTLEVARENRQNAIGLDVSHEYLQIAQKRLEIDKLRRWEASKKLNEEIEEALGALDGLPMFDLLEGD